MSRRFLSLSAFLLLACGAVSCSSAQKENDKQSDQQIETLMSQMTLEEKVGQMAQVTLEVVVKGKNRYESNDSLMLDSAAIRDVICKHHIGSILNISNSRARPPKVWNRLVGEIQDIALNETRLKVPIVYGIDAIHGVTYTAGATLFPQQIAMAATFDPQQVRNLADVTAYETRASSIPWNFSPVLDLGADPRFSRQYEGFGEDPYLSSVMGEEMINGYEGEENDVANPYKVAACIKHFFGYAVPASGKDRTPANIPAHLIKEYHLAPFKRAIEAGATSLMLNSGIVNGVPVHASYEIITKLLREELGFEGLIVTDWADIINLCERDRVAPTIKDAVRIAINAGIDMSMIPYSYEPYCESLVELAKEGAVPMSRIDDAVRRVLRFKQQLGLFDTPVTNLADYPDFGSKKFAQLAYNAATEAITLLKNDQQTLPLSPNQRLLVVGPNGNSMRSINGGWSYSWQGEKAEQFTKPFNTFYEALAHKFGSERVEYVAGVAYDNDIKYYTEHKESFERVLPAARRADVVVLCLGENSYAEGPGNLNDLTLSPLQIELALEVAKAGKPIVLILNEGRPRVIADIEPLCQAVVQTYLPSNYGGDALASILSGEVNPSGRLPYTYPKAPSTFTTYYHKPSEATKTMAGAYNYSADFTPQYPFGHGLSYTTFSYKGLSVTPKEFKPEDTLTISVEVTNSGEVAGKEVVMLYTSDLYASITPDVKRLRRFQKVELQPNESRIVTFKLSPQDLAFVDATNQWKLEAGEFKFAIDKLSTKAVLKP